MNDANEAQNTLPDEETNQEANQVVRREQNPESVADASGTVPNTSAAPEAAATPAVPSPASPRNDTSPQDTKVVANANANREEVRPAERVTPRHDRRSDSGRQALSEARIEAIIRQGGANGYCPLCDKPMGTLSAVAAHINKACKMTTRRADSGKISDAVAVVRDTLRDGQNLYRFAP